MTKAKKTVQDSLGSTTRRVRNTVGSAGGRAQRAAQRVGGMAVTSGERAQIASQGFLAGVASAAGHLQQIPGDAWDTIFRECPVPMFILPQGPDPEKYFIVFGFDEVFDNLKSGVFVRPRLEAWASRGTGWDIEHLGEELKTEFNRQFEVSRQRVVQSGSVDVSKLESEAERLAEEKSGKLERASSALIKSPMWLGMAGLAVNPFTWPVTWPFSLIFLALSLSHGRDIIKLSLEYFSLRSNNDATNRELRQRKRALEEQERKFDSKNESFQHAIGRIDVKVHPQLQDLYQQICQKEGVFSQPSASGSASGSIPDARRYLENADYLQKLPAKYRKLPALLT